MVHGEFGPDGLGCGGPDEGFGHSIGCGDVAGDCRFEIIDRAKDAPLEAVPREFGEEPFDGVQPGARRGREVEGLPRVIGEPRHDVGVLVSGVIVEDGMDHLSGGHGSLDGSDEADELLMAVSGHAAAYDLAFQHAR